MLPLPAGSAKPARPASAGGLNLEQRVDRIEELLPLLATKEDLQNTEKSLRAEMKADLQATEAKLEAAIDKSREATEAKLEAAIDKSREATEAKLEAAIETKLEIAIANLRTEIGEKLQEQMQSYVLINAGMVTMLGALLLTVMKFMLLPASLEGPVRTAMRQLKKEERQASQAKDGEGGGGKDGDEGDSKRP